MRLLYFLLAVPILLVQVTAVSGQIGNTAGYITTTRSVLLVAGVALQSNFEKSLPGVPLKPGSGYRFLTTIQKKGQQHELTIRQTERQVRWISGYAMGSLLNNSYVHMRGLGMGIALTRTFSKYHSFTSFGEIGVFRGSTNAPPTYTYDEPHIHAGWMVNVYPLVFLGASPTSTFVLSGGFDLGMRFLQIDYPQINKTDKTLSMRWSSEVVVGRDESAAFMSIGANILIPVSKFGDSTIINIFLKFNKTRSERRKGKK